MSRYDFWPAYVSVADKRAKAEKFVAKKKKAGESLNPVVILGRTITNTFWGKAWCKNIESYSDYASRLPRGRSYARHGSVVDLKITAGKINASVLGSELYQVEIIITPMLKEKWMNLVELCSGKIDSMIELLQGKFEKSVMELMTAPKQGLFPVPQEIKLKCSCLDWADMCKHVAAVMYGIGYHLDKQPEWLFLLRQVDHMDLIVSASMSEVFNEATQSDAILDEDLSAIFGIDMETEKPPEGDSKKKINKKPTKAKTRKKSPKM